jgi:tetratricopeptide (TPR) repeat protein/SAM-dependent methyltransferase
MNRKERRAAQKKSRRTPAPSNSSSNTGVLYDIALSHHQAGQVADAERICREILAAHPSHGETLHLLGLIAHQSGRNDMAIELIGKAVIANPQSSSFQYSAGYVLHAMARVQEAITYYRQAIALDPNAVQAHMALANAYLEQQRLDEAALEYEHTLRIRPDYAVAFFMLGNVLQLQDRLQDAIAQYQQALHLKPNFPELHNNLGNALRQQGKLEEAVVHCRKSLGLKPDNPEAWNNLGLGLQQQGLIPDAIDSYEQALAIRPDFIAALNNLSAAVLTQGNVELALSRSLRTLEIAETLETKALFVRCARSLGHQHSIPQPDKVQRVVVRALSEPWGRPSDLAYVTARLLKLDHSVDVHIERAGFTPTPEIDLSSLSAVYENQLLHSTLLAAPVSDPRLECFLTAVRRAILESAIANAAPTSNDASFMRFTAGLAQQCFINEYVFSYQDDEFAEASNLRDLLTTALQSKSFVPELWIAAVAAYFPLHSLRAELNGDRSWSEAITGIIVQQFVEPQHEKTFQAAIPRLTELADEVSSAVQRQYEENPYPRWVKTSALAQYATVGKLLQSLFPYAPFPNSSEQLDANILIAGCGTGQQSIETAIRFPRGRILAVDLSLASLGYASRKTHEAALNNVQYAQADILNLSSPEPKYDFIETTGVLHHLEDPLAGWRSLLALLRPGGVMRLGLYSALARRDIAEAQEIIAQHGYSPTATDIRRFRRDLPALNERIFNIVAKTTDFYSISGCRDALFNAKEHKMNLLEINRFVIENHLGFLGFNIDERVIQLFRRRFPRNLAANDLTLWHLFEKENPDTFIRMYQFWVQKLP